MLRDVIIQMDAGRYETFRNELVQSKAEKFCQLLDSYREDKLSEEEIQKLTATNNSSFYTLRSRLQDKIQEYLFRISEDSRAELLKTTATAPSLIYEVNRETAVVLMQYLESQLKEHDMPAELVVVYTALKKLHFNSAKFYEYQQRYNKNVAYMLAIDKAEELLSLFSAELGNYMISDDESKIDLMKLYLKELDNFERLYDSHRLRVMRGFAAAAYGIFVDPQMNIPGSEETVEDILKKICAILETYPNDRYYRYLFSAADFLWFEYYNRIGLYKNNAEIFARLSAAPVKIARLAHTMPIGKFFISSLERKAMNINSPNASDIPAMDTNMAVTGGDHCVYSISLFNAGKFFAEKNYKECAAQINSLFSEISFKKYARAETEARILLAFAYFFDGKTDLAESTTRSISRKISSEKMEEKYPDAVLLVKIIKVALSNGNGKKEKITALYKSFLENNSGPDSILKFLRLTDLHLDALSA
ncbi:MAG: hypothetical protein HY064_14085 [Bacteroidetes bacterium]|nr:hypothetical protein [Bacteroidota bacterium]